MVLNTFLILITVLNIVFAALNHNFHSLIGWVLVLIHGITLLAYKNKK